MLRFLYSFPIVTPVLERRTENSACLYCPLQLAYRISLNSQYVPTLWKGETEKAEKFALRKSWEGKTTATWSSKQQAVVTNLLLKVDLKIQVFIKFTFSHHTSKKFLHYSWVLKTGLMWSWPLREFCLPSFPYYSFLCHATVQDHPYTHRQMFLHSTIIWSVVANNCPITRESFLPHFHISQFWFGVVFNLFGFFNCSANKQENKNQLQGKPRAN